MAIYTKKGDKGETGLYDAESSKKRRVSKDSLRVSAIGAIDELNSFLGIIATNTESKVLIERLKKAQANLLTAGSILAGSDLRFFKTKTEKLEKIIDDIEEKVPPLKNFVIPGGSRDAARLHYARSLARKAERKIAALNKAEEVKPQILMYFNRLSDFLFMLAREQNYAHQVEEEIWRG